LFSIRFAAGRADRRTRGKAHELDRMRPQIALLTGGGDRPYALGLALALANQGVLLDFIGSDFLESPELDSHQNVRVLNLRGDMSPEAPALAKVVRVLKYYWRLFRYAISAEAPIFHILWNNKFETFDRTLLLWYYQLCGRRLVMTVHNVNIGKRDGANSVLNRLTLKMQYRACEHLFVHTELMKRELEQEFDVSPKKISVIPFGISSTVPPFGISGTAPGTSLTQSEARTRLGLKPTDQVLLFFGNIARYKGLELLVDALARLRERLPRARLIIAGRPKGEESYWRQVSSEITELGLEGQVIRRIEYVPDADTEIYFKAADVLVLPYRDIYQSGVLFLGYGFGLPVIATDVASMSESIIEGETGYTCRPADPGDLADKIEFFFSSALYEQPDLRRRRILEIATERYSLSKMASITIDAYRALARGKIAQTGP
jgi:D-inositol-3-phosphate glycosyltransferase